MEGSLLRLKALKLNPKKQEKNVKNQVKPLQSFKALQSPKALQSLKSLQSPKVDSKINLVKMQKKLLEKSKAPALHVNNENLNKSKEVKKNQNKQVKKVPGIVLLRTK